MKEYNYNGVRYKRDNNGQWQYFDPTYNKWVYTYYNAPSINGTAVYDSTQLEKIFKAKDPYLKETTTEKVDLDAANAKKAQDRSNILNSALIPTQGKINYVSKNAPTIENANALKELQVQKQKEDEQARKESELKQQEADRLQALRNSGSDNTRVDANNDALRTMSNIPTMEENFQQWENITKRQKEEARRLVMNGDVAKHFPHLTEYYLSKENSHRPGGPLTLEEIVLERMRTNPNFFEALDQRKFADFKRREQKAYDDMNWFEKGANFVTAFAADPIQTPWNLLTRWEGPLAYQASMSLEPEGLGEDYKYYDKMTHKSDGLLSPINDMINYVNPFRSAVSAGMNLGQGDYGDAAWDAATIIPLLKGAKYGWKGMNALMKAKPISILDNLGPNMLRNSSPLVQKIANKASVGTMLGGYGAYEGVTHNFPNAFKAYSEGDIGKGNEELLMGMLMTTPLAMEVNASKVIPRTVNALKNTKSTALPVMGETAEFAPATVASEIDDAARLKPYSDSARYEYKTLTADDAAKLKAENPNINTEQVLRDQGVPTQEVSIYNEGKLGQAEAFDDSGDFAVNWGMKDIDKYNEMVANTSEADMLSAKITRLNASPTNQQIMQKASDINKVIMDDYFAANNIKSYDEFLKTDLNDFYKFQNQKISELAAQDPDVITILKNNENLWNQRQALINKRDTIRTKLAAGAEDAIDPVFKEKVIELYRKAGVPEDQIPKNAFQNRGQLITDFGKERTKLVDMDYRDPLSEPSFAALSDSDQMILANDWKDIGGVRTGESSITLASKVHEPQFHTVRRRDWSPVTRMLEEPREYTPWKPWTWKNKNFVPRSRTDWEPFYHDEPTLIETTTKSSYSPEYVGGVNVHEVGHDYQKFYDYWASLLGEYDPAVGYFTGSGKNPIAQRFKDAMVEAKPVDPVTGKRVSGTWESAPIELHSELMRARYDFYTQMKAAKPELSQQQIMDWIKNAEANDDASLFDFYNKQLGKHFKETTKMTERRDLIKLLPVVIPAVGFGVMEGMKNATESETPQNRYGGNIKTLSKFIRK